MDDSQAGSEDIGPNLISRNFTDRKSCVRTLLISIAISIATVALTTLLFFCIFFVVHWVMTDGSFADIPYGVVVFLTLYICGIFSWPIGVLLIATITAIGTGVVAIRFLIRHELPPSSTWLPLLYPENIKRYMDARQLTTISKSVPEDEFMSLLGVTKRLRVNKLFALKIEGNPSEWYRVITTNQAYNVLCVSLKHDLPPAVINSQIEDYDILPNRYVDAVKLDMNDQLSRYFDIWTIPDAEKSIYELLPPDVLWQVLIDFDSCDVAIRNRRIFFVWPEGMLSDAVFDGRTHQISRFVASLNHSVRHNFTISGRLEPTIRKRRLDSIQSLLLWAVVIAMFNSILIGIVTLFSVHDRAEAIVSAFLFPAMLFLPSLLFGVCVMFSVLLTLISLRTSLYVSKSAASVSKIKKYMFYYEGRV